MDRGLVQNIPLAQSVLTQPAEIITTLLKANAILQTPALHLQQFHVMTVMSVQQMPAQQQDAPTQTLTTLPRAIVELAHVNLELALTIRPPDKIYKKIGRDARFFITILFLKFSHLPIWFRLESQTHLLFPFAIKFFPKGE